MRIKELQDLLIEKLGLNLTNRMIQRRTDEFLNVGRAENDDAREYTEAEARQMVTVCALVTIGVGEEDVKGILDGSKDINTVISCYLSMQKVCFYVSELFRREK